MVDTSIFAKILNKEEFVKQALVANIDPQVIEKEWGKIEQIFVLLYLEAAYDMLSESDKAGLALKLAPNAGVLEIQNFTSKMAQFLNNNPDAVDIQAVVKKAVDETLKQYIKYLEKGGK